MRSDEQATASKRVFHLSTPGQLFIKFAWEVDNLNTALAEQEHRSRSYELAAYHIFNTAVTAWHLTDWTWNSLSEDARTQLASELGFAVTKNHTENLKTFQVALRLKSRALEICWDVANGSKHLDTHKNSKVNAKVEVDIKRATAGELRAGQPLEKVSYDYIVDWMGQSLRIVDVFEEVRDFWMQLLAGRGLVGNILVDIKFDVKVVRKPPPPKP